MRATGGIGIVLSSGAVSAGEMRGTEDMINLLVSRSCYSVCSADDVRSCTLIGLTPAQAKDTLTVNPQRAILRGRESPSSLTTYVQVADDRATVSMRQAYRGIISNPSLITKSLVDPPGVVPTKRATSPTTPAAPQGKKAKK